MTTAEFVSKYGWDTAGWLVFADVILVTLAVCWILHIKRETMSAIAWCLTVLLVPFLGIVLFYLFGYQTIHRPITKKRKRRRVYDRHRSTTAVNVRPEIDLGSKWGVLEKLGHHKDGFHATGGNRITLYHHGKPAFDAMIEAIDAAEHHVHLEFFIFRGDATARRFTDALVRARKRGVEVRFAYDSVGSFTLLPSRLFDEVKAAGGEVAGFLPPFNPLYRLRVNLRNHRKILIADGRVGFTGGLNIGGEYLGLHPKFGPWRDTHFRVEGPAVESLQKVFLEDWHFATNKVVKGPLYTPRWKEDELPGSSVVQVVHSGPDADYKAVRETYFAAITRAQDRVWIASPYFVPDAGLRDALCLAARSGIDVRFLGLFRPDKWIPYLAARFYWDDVIAAGVKVYQYAPGMMHSKYVLVDGEWASVGSANFDNRSLLLNFEANCQLFDAALVEELEREFLRDLEVSVRLDPTVYAARPLVGRIAENAARLFSPIL
jgi:cardiolipin synthase